MPRKGRTKWSFSVIWLNNRSVGTPSCIYLQHNSPSAWNNQRTPSAVRWGQKASPEPVLDHICLDTTLSQRWTTDWASISHWTENVRFAIRLAGSLHPHHERFHKKEASGLQYFPFMYTRGDGEWSNKHIWLKHEIWTLYLSLASMGPVSMPVVAPADAVKKDVNELLSHVGWCLWGSSQDSLHVLSLFAVWRLWCAAWLQRVARGQTGGDQLSTRGPCCTRSLTHQQSKGSALRAGVCVHVCVSAPVCVRHFVCDACLLMRWRVCGKSTCE